MPDTLFKTGYDQLVTRLGQITGLRVFDDPRNINVPCVVVEAPSIMMASNVVADMQFRVIIVGQGTGDNRTLDQLLDLADLVREAQIGLTEARPTTIDYGGQAYPAYELTISTKVAP
jgi:hypothetical protein